MHISQNIYYTKALECFIKISRMVHTEIQLFVKVILSSLQTSSDTFANSADPDETARDEPSYQDIHDIPFCLIFFTETPICNNGCVRVQRLNSPCQKLQG